jgi:hypothetical protein
VVVLMLCINSFSMYLDRFCNSSFQCWCVERTGHAPSTSTYSVRRMHGWVPRWDHRRHHPGQRRRARPCPPWSWYIPDTYFYLHGCTIRALNLTNSSELCCWWRVGWSSQPWGFCGN